MKAVLFKLFGKQNDQKNGYQQMNQDEDIVNGHSQTNATTDIHTALKIAENSVDEFVSKPLPKKAGWALTNFIVLNKSDNETILNEVDKEYRFVDYTQMKRNLKHAESILNKPESKLLSSDEVQFRNKLIALNDKLKPYHEAVIKSVAQLRRSIKNKTPKNKETKGDGYFTYMKTFVKKMIPVLQKFEEVYQDLPEIAVAFQPAATVTTAVTNTAAKK